MHLFSLMYLYLIVKIIVWKQGEMDGKALSSLFNGKEFTGVLDKKQNPLNSRELIIRIMLAEIYAVKSYLLALSEI